MTINNVSPKSPRRQPNCTKSVSGADARVEHADEWRADQYEYEYIGYGNECVKDGWSGDPLETIQHLDESFTLETLSTNEQPQHLPNTLLNTLPPTVDDNAQQ